MSCLVLEVTSARYSEIVGGSIVTSLSSGDPDYRALEEKLGVKFNDIGLLKTACTHDHYLNEPPGKGLESYERLEFLGDAVLRLVVSQNLYREASVTEGEMSRQRDKLVEQGSATRAATMLGLWQYLLLSPGERNQPPNPRILAEVYEALIGAIYLDRGYDAACTFVHRTLIKP